MKVYVNGQWLDSNTTPIMLILSGYEKRCVERMAPDASRFLIFPEGESDADMEQLLLTPEPEK